MGCGDEKLSKYLTQTFIAHCNAMICQQVTLSCDAEWPKVADAVIEAICRVCKRCYTQGSLPSNRVILVYDMRHELRQNSACCHQEKTRHVAFRRHDTLCVRGVFLFFF